MNTRLHIWIGNPKSVSEMNHLKIILERLVPADDSPGVVFEERFLTIPDLADGFTQSEDEKKLLTLQAEQQGVSVATAMFGMTTSSNCSDKVWPASLHYLGSIAMDETDREL